MRQVVNTGYVIVGQHPGSEMELIGVFASAADAVEWCDANGMYKPYTIVWMNDYNDEIYKAA